MLHLIYIYSHFQKITFFVLKLQKLLIYICLILLGTRCAQITPLTGGKKDTIPPKPLGFKPPNASLNFNSKVIEISFDEYISLKDIANQFIITPQTKETPEFSVTGKILKITFNEDLIANTTYKLAFGNAIVDINEANVLQNFEYIFSTGASIDSLSVSGSVKNALNHKPSDQVLIALYDALGNDSVIYKEKPLYITKTNSLGNFKINYLPNQFFKIVAIKDQNKNLLYDGSEEQIAFSDNLVNTNDSSQIDLLMFKEVPFKSFIKKSYSPEYGKAYVIFNKPQFNIRSVNSESLIHYQYSMNKDSLTLYYKDQFDTLKTIISYGDLKADTISIKILSQQLFEKELKNKNIKYDLRANFGTTLPIFLKPRFTLNVPIESSKISDFKFTLIEKMDSSIKKIPFSILKNANWVTEFNLEANFKPETNYTMIIERGAISNKSGRMNDSVSYQFKTTSEEDYAQLKLKIFLPKKENYIVMLLNEKEDVVNETLIECSLASTSERIVEYKNLLAGKYFIRVVEDANKNGLFDAGEYFKKRQPETIYNNLFPIKLLAGWEIENEWIVK